MQIRSTISLAAALLLAGTVPAQAAQANGESAKQAQAKPAAGEKKVCRKLVTSGSRFAERVCLTKEEWKKVEAQG